MGSAFAVASALAAVKMVAVYSESHSLEMTVDFFSCSSIPVAESLKF